MEVEDRFNEQIKESKQLLKNVNIDIKKRMSDNKQESTVMVSNIKYLTFKHKNIQLDANIRGVFGKLEKIVSLIVQKLKQQRDSPDKYKIDVQEYNRRMKLFQEVNNNYILTKKEYENYILKHAVSVYCLNFIIIN